MSTEGPPSLYHCGVMFYTRSRLSSLKLSNLLLLLSNQKHANHRLIIPSTQSPSTLNNRRGRQNFIMKNLSPLNLNRNDIWILRAKKSWIDDLWPDTSWTISPLINRLILCKVVISLRTHCIPASGKLGHVLESLLLVEFLSPQT